jgi:hypothetical protein
LSGIWCLTQSINDKKKTFDTSHKAFFDFNKDSVELVTIGDLETGDYSKINITKGAYYYTNSSLTLKADRDQMKFKVTKENNSIYLSNKKLNINNVEFKQLDTTLKNQVITKDCFKGSYLITSPNYKDSIDFINDSVLLYTGEYSINFPAKKWEIINYKGFNILNIHKSLNEIIIIKSCSKDNIDLVSPFFNDLRLTLRPTSSDIHKNDLYGNWIEISNSEIKPPLPPGLNPGEELLKLEINSESIKKTVRRRKTINKWEISNDGKRIYFTDKLDQFTDESFSWKILNLEEDKMTLKIISSNGFTEEIIQLIKE